MERGSRLNALSGVRERPANTATVCGAQARHVCPRMPRTIHKQSSLESSGRDTGWVHFSKHAALNRDAGVTCHMGC